MVSLRRKLYDRAATAGLAGLAVALGLCVYAVSRPARQEAPKPAPAPVKAKAVEPRVTEADLAVIGAAPIAPLARPEPPPAPEKPPLKLRGIICGDADGTAVFIEAGGKTAVCRVGEMVDGWTLDVVLPDAARFSRAGKQITLEVERRAFADAGASVSRSSEAPAPMAKSGASYAVSSAAAQPSSAAARTDKTAPSSRQVSPGTPAGVTRVSLSRETVAKAKQDPLAAVEGVKYEFGSGGQGGLLLSAVPAQSLAARCGLAPGDRIVAVNGQPINSPNQALEMYARCRDSAKVVVTFERQGKRREVEYSVP